MTHESVSNITTYKRSHKMKHGTQIMNSGKSWKFALQYHHVGKLTIENELQALPPKQAQVDFPC